MQDKIKNIKPLLSTRKTGVTGSDLYRMGWSGPLILLWEAAWYTGMRDLGSENLG